jgi:3-oxoacyl-[acyl-carrier protein] reductase
MTTIGQTTGAAPRSALVLGGSSGIGADVVRVLARNGHDVAVGHLSGEDRAADLVGAAVDAGGRALAVRADVRTEQGVVDAFAAAEAELGGLDVVVHCVGGWTFTKLVDLTVEEMDEMWALNLRSALLVLREAARRLRDDGRVVLLSSAAADLAPARQIGYAAAKSGLETAARVAAKELGKQSITVNVVRPGATDTPQLRRTTSEKAIEAMSAAPALRRLGQPDDIAEVVGFLCSDRARWVTGAVLDATGGLR